MRIRSFSGVAEVHYGNDLLIGSWSPQKERIRKGFHPKHSGDLIINILPGWTVIQEKESDNRVIRLTHTPTPLIFIGAGIKPTIIRTPISIECLAPTLSGIMRIRAPNACNVIPLILK